VVTLRAAPATSFVPSGNVPSTWISPIISLTPSITASSGRIVGAMLMISGDRLAVTNELEDFRGDQRNGFRMVKLQAARASSSRKLTGAEDEELVDFAWSQMHRKTS
jgi:hypothetical protein